MREAASQSGLILEEIELGYKEGMIQLLARHPGIKAIFMGQRKTDPYGAHLDEVHPSDSDRGWPLFLRVNPILAWSFKDVWNFLRGYKLDYCCLYDQGYTSLGDVHKTRKNDDLLVEGKYMPAYMLGDELKERSGRKSFGVQKKGDIGLIIVGNEILSGMIQDSNSRFLCRELRKLGFHVQRISVIPDEIDKIGAEACSFSPEFDYVFICGGLGPTLDDVTMKGISYGFKVPLERNAALLEALKLALGDKFMPKHLVMANIPKGSELIFSESNPYPLVMFK
jgi:molybdenum cofactor synthesis domain-containing protein